MKASKILIAAGIALAGVGAYCAYKYSQHPSISNEMNSTPEENADTLRRSEEKTILENHSSQNFYETKQTAANAVQARHRAAGQMMKDSLDNIFHSDSDVAVSDDEELNQLNQELDDMLKK